MTTCAAENADLWLAYSEAIRPPEDLTPSEFSVKHRKLHAIYCSENPGPWENTTFPYQPDVMDLVKEAIESGKKGVVFMKAGQIGGTDCMINGMCWLKVHYPGPQLFMTSTDKVAEEFGRERFALIIPDMPPLQAKYVGGARDQILVKRFSDGKIVLCGGQSVFNLQSSPYRVVVIDELDSLVADLGGTGDPLSLAEVRTNSFSGETLIIAYAHPTIKDHGAGKLYYELSDQRRGFITHAACGHEFWLDWFNVVHCLPRFEGQTQEQASKDPSCYQLVCPGCGSVIDEAERVAMLRAGVRQKSTLPPEVAATKTWIGPHASQLYTPFKSIRSFAERYIEALGDEQKMRVFVNKVLGDVFEPKVKEVDLTALRSLIVVKRRVQDPEFYSRGQVPPGVLFLTAGQDSRNTQLHHAVWGWGQRKTIDGNKLLCGWLIDWGEMVRPFSNTFTEADYYPFNDLIYERRYMSTQSDRLFHVRACAHDVGYAPTLIPITRYCRQWPQRAFPARGAAETMTSASTAAFVRMGVARKSKAGDEEVVDEPAMLFNTYMLKTNWYGFVDQRIEVADLQDGQSIGTRKVPLLNFPEDVDDDFLEQTKNEKLGRGKKGELVWGKSGANHYADCNTYAYGVALHFDAFSHNMTPDEYNQRRVGRREQRGADRSSDSREWGGRGADPSMG